MRVIVTGGGTGGHIYPALAIAQGIAKHFPSAEILYAGNSQGMEYDLATRAGYEFHGISVAGLPRPISLKTFKVLGANIKGLAQANKLIKKFRPDLVVGTGGYACGPIMLAAALKGVPTLLHEQNAVMGVTNKILSNYVKVICLTFPLVETKEKFKSKSVLTGLPVRDIILQANDEAGKAFFGFDSKKPLVFITGGSQGALTLNNGASQVWQKILAADGQILHIAGPKQFDAMDIKAQEQGLKKAGKYQEGFLLLPYLHEMEQALGGADIIIGRAGASFLAEVMAVGRPGIWVPYPYASGNHQQANANVLVEHDAGKMILDKDFNGDTLWNELLPLLQDKALRDSMSAKAWDLGSREAVDHIIAQAEKIMKK